CGGVSEYRDYWKQHHQSLPVPGERQHICWKFLVHTGGPWHALEATKLYDRLPLLLHDAKRRGTAARWPEPWSISRKMSLQTCFCLVEPLSAALSALNLLMHFTDWLSFFLLVKYRLPLRPQKKRMYYEYTGLWHIYAILSMNAWIWSSLFHT
ncbi:hypothetical protein CFC21_069407, partial [Triticum aestivum]